MSMAGTAERGAEVATETVQFPSDGVAIRAFLAGPAAASGPSPAVLVIHEWWGLNDHIQDIARRFARAGFVALVPDLYSRHGNKVTKDSAEAAVLMNALSAQLSLRDLNTAVQYVKTLPGVDPLRIGAVGFCMGGTFTLTLATHNSDVKAAVPFYGKVPPLETMDYLLCPVLYHWGAKDGWVTRQEVDRLRQGLEQFGKPGRVCIYPEADHAFFNDTRPEVYRQTDAQLAWDRTLEFLGEHLR